MSGSALAAAGGAPASGWHLGALTPSGQTLSNAQAASVANGVATFAFPGTGLVNLLTTDQKAKSPTLLGDLTGASGLSATVSASDPGGTFTYSGQGQPWNTCAAPATVRFFFETSNAGGFDETHYWWSNPVSLPMASLLAGPQTMSTDLNGSSWSDYFGHSGNDPAYAAGYQAALGNVGSIGLSFGGGCFFENGVGTADGLGSFTLNAFSAQ